ncbi:MAG: hypothetical protein C4346_15045, partial [Chloroflexota bacterium]
MFRGNPERTGELPGPGPSGKPVLLWRFETAAPVVVSAAVAHGTVYAGSWDHGLYALDASTGRQRWRFEARAGFFSSPALHAGMVIAGDNAGRLY